jgi:hypothetical protein
MNLIEKEFGRIVLFTAMVLLINFVLLIASIGTMYFFIHLLLLISNTCMLRFLWIISPEIDKKPFNNKNNTHA